MNIRNLKNRRWVSVTFYSLVLEIMLVGCSDLDTNLATFGDSVTVRRSYTFYIASDNGKYVRIPKETYNLMLTEPIWSASDGLVLDNPDLDLSPVDVEWTTSDYRYTAKGLELQIKVNVKVAENTSVGEHTIFIKLPNLIACATALRGYPMIPKVGVMSSSLEVGKIKVYASAVEKNKAEIIRSIPGIILILFIIAALLSML